MNDANLAIARTDRALMARDLARLAELLTPLMLARLQPIREMTQEIGFGPFRRSIPLGALIYSRLAGLLPPMISGALEGVTSLTDDELGPLAAVIAGELGAWCLARSPLSDAELAAGLPGLVALLGERPPAGWAPPTDDDPGELLALGEGLTP